MKLYPFVKILSFPCIVKILSFSRQRESIILNRMKFSNSLWFLFLLTNFSSAAELRFEHFSVSEGLSQSTVLCILQDSKGFMWFGTENGLNRYDGYKFTVYKRDPENPNSLSNNYIWALQEEPAGVLWIATNNGLNRFDTIQQTITRYFHDETNPNSLSHNDIRALYQDRQGMLWIGTMMGLNRFDPKTQTFTRYQHQENDPTSLSHNQIGWAKAIYEDRQGNLWFGTFGGGLNKFDRQTETFTHFQPQPNNPQSLSNKEINAIFEDRTGILWIGGRQGLDKFDPATSTATHYFQETVFDDLYQDKSGLLWLGMDGQGIYRFNPETGHYDQYQYDSRKPSSLSNAFVTFFHEDTSGALWIGTWGGGVNRFDPAMKPFGYYPYQPYNTQGLNGPAVFSICEDVQGEILWIGLEGGGLDRFDRKTGIFTHYQHDERNLNSLVNDNIYAIMQDTEKIVWLATWGGISRFDPLKNQFTNYVMEENNPNSLNGNETNTLVQDQQGQLWIGTWYGGLNRFDPKTQKFTHYRYEEANPNSLGADLVVILYSDRQGTLWAGTGNGGLNRFNPKTQTFTRYQHDDKDANSLSSDYVMELYEDTQGRFWVGTNGGGLNRMDRATGKFKVYRQTDTVVNKILEDDNGYLWLGTLNGLSRFDPQTESFRNYLPEDGLQGKEFLGGTKLRSGELAFGGRTGFNLFHPSQIKDNPFIPPVVFTDFKLFNRSVVPGTHPALSKNIIFTEALTLSHHDTVFSFEFTALNYLSPHQNHYLYKMEGFDEKWSEVDSYRRLITYTNLHPGQYTFRVKGSNNDSVWNDTGAAIKLTVLPPWWQTELAYLIYFVVIVGGLVALFTAQQRKLAHTREMNERLQQVDKLKDEFLANTSHELRTPLNGIIGLAESLIEGAAGSLSEKMKLNLVMIVTSGRRLATLVNDILDFSKLKHKTIDLQLKPVYLREITDVVLFLSRPLVAQKSLQLINAIDEDLPPVYADENRLQQILHNLLGNAIKFTESGQVKVTAQLKQSVIKVTVADTGIGIPVDKQARIFESFEQADGSTARDYGGTGLGLAVTKQLVELHGGTLKVSSNVGVGSEFTFTLPLAPAESSQMAAPATSHVAKLQPETSRTVISAETIGVVETTPAETEEQFHVLVVDDEPVNLQVLNNLLSLQAIYHIVQAASGPEAIRLIEEGFKPDIVLLDVMMPKMTGYEVTQKLREKWALNELPILLLTAKNRVEDLLTGLDAGANDYLTKPFSKDELLARIKTHLNVKQLQAENMRMQAELEVSRQLQQVLLPRERELAQIHGLEIAGFMEPAAEVGGDYYDVLVHAAGVKIGIGDVTGHGLESGILAMMVQTAVRTLLTHGETNPVKFLVTINRTIYDNAQRMEIERNLTLCLLDWQENQLRISGQHEEVLIIRNGNVESVDTLTLGFTIGLEQDITDFVAEKSITLQSGDVIILYTDGVTEAENINGEFYGSERLHTVASQHGQESAVEIKQAIIEDVYQFVGQKPLLDDVTVVVLKQN